MRDGSGQRVKETLQNTNIQIVDSGLILTVQSHDLFYTHTANTHIQSNASAWESCLLHARTSRSGEEEALPSTRRKRMEEYRKKENKKKEKPVFTAVTSG